MIKSDNPPNDVDYWYANTTCQVDSGATFPCEEIYFKKNTDIPLQYTRVARHGWVVVQDKINYQIISIGKPDEKYFDSILKNWTATCRDVNLGLFFNPQSSKIDLHQSAKVQIWLITPPHRINASDTVRIQWKSSECNDCFTLSPKELTFNIANFQVNQTLTITRVKNGSKTQLIPIFKRRRFRSCPSRNFSHLYRIKIKNRYILKSFHIKFCIVKRDLKLHMFAIVAFIHFF